MKKCRHAVLPLVLLLVTTCLPAEAAEKITLQYHPKVGEKRTLRMSSNLLTFNSMPSGQECSERIWTFTLEVEPISVADDGSVVTRIGFLKIYVKSFRHSDSHVFHEYDSTEDLFKGSAHWNLYGAALGESFTVVTSAQGKLIKLNPDAFYDAMARNHMKHEDEEIQQMPKGSAAEKLKRLKEKYATPGQRKRAYKEAASKSILYRPEQLQLLASNVLVPFAPEPVANGDTWRAPLMVSIEAPIELTGTYTLKTAESGVCTIQVDAWRTPRDKAIGQAGPAGLGPRLSGPCQATLTVDRATACLLARQDVMNLTGELFTPGHSAAKPDGTTPVTIKATMTVEEVK